MGRPTRMKLQNITITTLEKKHTMGVDHKQEVSHKEIQKHNSKDKNPNQECQWWKHNHKG